MQASDWQTFDRQHIWHPYTSMLDPLETIPVVAAKGVYLHLADGRRLVDGMSSWWAAIHGYNHPQLNAAINEQLQAMAHVMFGGLTHPAAIELAQRLIAITAEPLQQVFFADSGSVAVEVAIKMALQYQVAQGCATKQKLLTVHNGYHGDTFGAMAVCDPVNGMHGLFQAVLPQHLFASAPHCDGDKLDPASFADLSRLLIAHHQDIAAVILEPIVQGAGGMRFYCAEYLRQLRVLCDEYQVLLILDEIATGFGRTGTLFAYEQADIYPDILCVGKALTGGYLSLAATLTTEKVAQGIGTQPLMHGPTFMANPLACRVASASIDLLLQSNWQAKVATIEQQLKTGLQPCQAMPQVDEVRVKGAIGVVQLRQVIDMQRVQPQFVELGVWLRPFGKLIYIMPPFIITPTELNKIIQAVINVVSHLPTNT
jgi:adenosylmethionine-8-amino-7-oxononanoate aminotransferase